MKPRRASSQPKRGLIEFKLSDMYCEFIEVWQFHIVAVEVAQMGIGIVWHRQLMTFKDVRGQGEDLLGITAVVEGNAHAGGDDLGSEE